MLPTKNTKNTKKEEKPEMIFLFSFVLCVSWANISYFR